MARAQEKNTPGMGLSSAPGTMECLPRHCPSDAGGYGGWGWVTPGASGTVLLLRCEPGWLQVWGWVWVFLPRSLVWLPWLCSARKWGYQGHTWLCVVLVLCAKHLPLIFVCMGLGTHACPVGALMGLVAAILHWGAWCASEGASPAMGQGLPVPRRGEFTGESGVTGGEMGERWWQVSCCHPPRPPALTSPAGLAPLFALTQHQGSPAAQRGQGVMSHKGGSCPQQL